MPGPCPQGQPTQTLHAKCQDRDKCTGPGCRVRRPKRVDPILTKLQRAELAKLEAAAEVA